MKIKLLALGKMKNSAFAEVGQEYSKRIRRYHPFEVVEIPDETIRGSAALEKALKKEAQKIEKKLKPGSYLIAVDEKGEQWSSVEWAWQFKQLFESSSSEIVFLIGGAYGLSEEIKSKAKVLLSLSKLTLPHQLARVLTLEQIYRALTILRNVPYHHD